MNTPLLGACLISYLILPWLGEKCLRRWGHLQTNFRGVAIPQSFGVIVLLQTTLLFSLLAKFWPQQQPSLFRWELLCAVFGLLGLVDDLWGTPHFRGLRGHLRALFQDGKLTTGLLKAVGGGLFALGFSYQNFAPHWLRVVFGGLVIALFANAINLLDLRPGRAIAVFLVIALPLLLLTPRPLHHPLLFLMLGAASLWPYDARGRAMLGDAGSNLLGAAAGFACAATLPLSGLVGTLLLLCTFHALTERVSLSKLIEENRVLRFLDRLTGLR
ncbi:UDP-N-acetylmuramyl pentapeptide phosphotransferase/UDP-N-acetylglucosamine-1-phosphate transferase [Chthonomonas calidirosea]|uniref:hypothetical protein n=1 Tax=Chthonomonas calidirosea TaxID=454171 RepID=UPI0006DD4836|nr:hypothetical protein [Chthonomonas calidirosea]CEK19646.1 UDP-N-acetylmuramyl pentapeptide phosphotransferase/UDP-N-acetylglucosamine-1-phosphate transferase [Chthonomonas calidirosea]